VHLTCGILRDLQAFFWLRVFPAPQALSTPAHTQVTQTVGTPLAQQGYKKNKTKGDGIAMKLHIFIDGSWLFKACGANKVLAGKTESPEAPFPFSFEKLNSALLKYIQEKKPSCDRLGDIYFSTSIFELPANFDSWDIQQESIEIIKKGVYARTAFTKNAIDAGYSDKAVYRPKMKTWMVTNLQNGNYQEKQVDASVVALMVRSAIISSNDYHAVLTGDSDILPAIAVAYPEYTRNVVIVTSHPDELKADYRQASYSLNNFTFDVPPFFLQEHVINLMAGENVYRCTDCGKIFVRPKPIPSKSQPHCKNCFRKRE
jgi:DNA-directed RNA polymerase subunit RPC12/RpoP